MHLCRTYPRAAIACQIFGQPLPIPMGNTDENVGGKQVAVSAQGLYEQEDEEKLQREEREGHR